MRGLPPLRGRTVVNFCSAARAANISKTGPLNCRSLHYGRRDDKGRGSAFSGEWLVAERKRRSLKSSFRAIMVHTTLMTHDKTVLVVGCSGLPVMSAVSTVLSSWKVEYARDNEE